ncbi:hypothetical protein FHS27_006465 [Rhodopirellula rubra]|uniref:Serine protease n=1 Tax=Aporhodopirellula rubra TaxID=980271 RepID=A0A7W5E7A2_9BACT|nr:trypsin-like peptidase domain-containing protein [Aporhodopirellula rubra]MBB3210617.1 hypothetical protein [Aporhodopirellula rubra]
MCRISLTLLAVVSLGTAIHANEDSTDRVLRASCRVFAGNARGSGVIFDADEDNYHVLTNAHVVGRVGNRVSLEFEHSGYRSRPIAGRVVRSHIARTTSIDLAIVELPRSAFPGPMPVVPLAEVGFKDDSPTVLTCGAQGGAAVSLQRGHIVRQTRGLIYYKPEALPGRSGSPLFNDDGSRVIGLVAWRTGDGHGLAMNAAAVRSFVHGEVAEVETALPDDAIPLWQSSTMLVLVTSEGCRPCELQKQAIPDDVRYQTFDIEYVNEKGYRVESTPTFMVFVDRKLQEQRSGLLRGDRLRAFLNRWGFGDDDAEPDDSEPSDDFNPWTNKRRWERGQIRDRIDEAKDRFTWWLIGKWLGFAGGGAAIVFPWLFFIYRALRKLRSSDNDGCPANKPPSRRRSPKRPRKPTATRQRKAKR